MFSQEILCLLIHEEESCSQLKNHINVKSLDISWTKFSCCKLQVLTFKLKWCHPHTKKIIHILFYTVALPLSLTNWFTNFHSRYLGFIMLKNKKECWWLGGLSWQPCLQWQYMRPQWPLYWPPPASDSDSCQQHTERENWLLLDWAGLRPCHVLSCLLTHSTYNLRTGKE